MTEYYDEHNVISTERSEWRYLFKDVSTPCGRST